MLAAGWAAWAAPFFLIKHEGLRRRRSTAGRAEGIFIQGIGFAILWMNNYFARSPSAARIAASVGFLTLGSVLSRTSARTLGTAMAVSTQASTADHQLVQSGAYRVVRHPIYASMLCMLLGTGFLITPMLALLAALMFFLSRARDSRADRRHAAGAHRFGEAFVDYQRRVPAYLPFIRWIQRIPDP